MKKRITTYLAGLMVMSSATVRSQAFCSSEMNESGRSSPPPNEKLKL